MKYRFKVKKYEIKLTRKKAIAIFILIVAVAFGLFSYLKISECIIWHESIFCSIYKIFNPVMAIEYKVFNPAKKEYVTLPLNFTHDLRKVMKIPVYPSDEAVSSLILNQKIKNIFIVFKDSPDNALVAVEGGNIAYMLTFVLIAKGYKVKPVKNFDEMLNASLQGFITIFPREISSYENLSVDEENPTIALVPPALANETIVKVEDYVVFIRGKNKEDFELAATRFLLAAFGIKI